MLIYKDFLMLIRDFWGLVLMFLMPWTLVLLMAYLQDGTFRSVTGSNISLYLLDEDADSLGCMILKRLEGNQMFEVSTGKDGRKLSEKEVEEAVSQGDFMIGVVIPPKSTDLMREQVRRNMEKAFNQEDTMADPPIPPLEMKVFIDPLTTDALRSSLALEMKMNAMEIQNMLLFGEIQNQVNRLVPMPVQLNFNGGEILRIRESYAQAGNATIVPNSTQHNVPAWSMFAIFFIVVSLAGNMIREREIGCYSRLLTMPCSYGEYVFSKVCVYLVVCLLQLALMIVTGVYLMPLLGLEALKLGHDIGALVVVAVSSSLAAIGYGLAVGSVARTEQQANVFGAVSVVILAAIGGVWIPVLIMPPFMKLLSCLSPLNWGLNGFGCLFVRDGGWADVWPYVVALSLFFVAALLVSYGAGKHKSL